MKITTILYTLESEGNTLVIRDKETKAARMTIEAGTTQFLGDSLNKLAEFVDPQNGKNGQMAADMFIDGMLAGAMYVQQLQASRIRTMVELIRDIANADGSPIVASLLERWLNGDKMDESIKTAQEQLANKQAGMDEKDLVIAELRGLITNLNTTIDNLTTRTNELASELETKTQEHGLALAAIDKLREDVARLSLPAVVQDIPGQ